MKLRTLTLVPWMVLAGAAYGQIRSADVLYSFRESVPSPAFRVGDECFVSVDTANLWGWKITPDGDDLQIVAEGHTVHEPTRLLHDEKTFALRKAITDLGGQTDWTSGTDTLNVFSYLDKIGMKPPSLQSASPTDGPTLSADALLSFKAYPFYLNPGKTVIDLDGVRIGPRTAQELGTGAHLIQFRTNVVRVLIDTDFVPKLPASVTEASSLDFTIQRDPDQPAPAVQNTTAKPTDTSPPPPPSSLANIAQLSVSVDADSDSSTTLGIHVAGFQSQALVVTPDPDTIVLTLPGIGGVLPDGSKVQASAESIDSKPTACGTVLTIKLTRPMGSEVTSSSSGVSLTLLKPNVGNGKLEGKLIVVDPGHGGHDRGAHFGDLNEKDLTLAIGRQLAAKLAEAGATVILTRQTDVFIPLMTRSQIANKSHADFFISCHINSTGDSSRQSGTITFHHEGNKVGYVLACCIQHEIAKVNKLPNLGAWSDGRIYTTGFSVLRHTDAPAVLIEYGFINHPKDRARVVTAEFQDSVTSAVVRGVKVFLGETKANG